MNALYEGGSFSMKNAMCAARQTSRSVHMNPCAYGTADFEISTNAGAPSKSGSAGAPSKSGNAMQQSCRTKLMQVMQCVSFD